MDATKLRQIFERLDQALEHPTELLVREGAAVLAYGLEQRVTIDIDVLPASRFVEMDLEHFRLTGADLKEAFERLPARFQADPVVEDNLRFVLQDLL